MDVPAELPGMGLFDHAIVYIPGEGHGAESGSGLFIDATDQYARLGQLPIADQGRLSLIARPETSALMRIPEGIILLWPLFYATQWPGRSRGLTLGEWLWLLAWVCVVLIASLTSWEALAGLPTWLQPHATKPRLLWYALFAPALALLALVFLTVSLFRPPAPWTQNLGLALLVWPAGPSLAVLILGRFVAP